MRTGIAVSLSPAGHARLAGIAADRNSPQKHVWRARTVLRSAQGVGTNGIMRVTGKAKTCVRRWQERFMQAGVDGLLRDKSRPSRVPPLGAAVAGRVVALTLTEPPGATTHWTAAAMAAACAASVSPVHRIWRSHGLRPHQVRQSKLSRAPQFAAIASGRSDCEAAGGGTTRGAGQPLGLTPHDCERNGTTPLFAAPDVLEGSVIGRCMQRHRHQEFIRFLNATEAEVPAAKQVHVVPDNHAAPKHPKAVEWLGRHPHFAFHFTPTSASRRKPPASRRKPPASRRKPPASRRKPPVSRRKPPVSPGPTPSRASSPS